ncbi:hypothetical protein, partial [Leptospira barantonii]
MLEPRRIKFEFIFAFESREQYPCGIACSQSVTAVVHCKRELVGAEVTSLGTVWVEVLEKTEERHAWEQ